METTLKRVFSITALLAFGKSITDTASDIVEVQNVVDTAFKESAGEINQWSKEAVNKFGLSELAAKKYASRIMAMSNSMDISSKNGIILSKNIAQLSADLASFYNTDVDSAFEALNSVFTGQVRTLRQYGLNISEANLEQYRLAKGIKVAYSAMTEQQKVLLRYNYIMEHTRDIQGDFAKTSAAVANQWRLLQMNAKSLAGTLGSFLLPVLQTVLTYLNAIIRALNSFFGKLAQMVGITTPSYAAGIAVGNEVAEGWDNAAGAAAKYKATIAGFDELETLNPQGGGSGGGAGAGGLTGEDLFPEGLLSYDVDDNTKQLDLSFNHLLQLLDDKIQEIRGKAEELSGAFGEKVNGFVNYVDWPLMGKTVGDGLNLIVNAFDRFLEKIDFKNLGSKFAEGVNSIFSTVEWDEIGHNFSLRFNSVFDTIRGFLDKFDFSNAASGLLTSFKTAMAEIKWEEAGETIGIGINKIFGFLDELLNGKIVSDLGIKIATAINKAVSTVDAAQIGRVADGFLTQILAAIDAIDWRQIGNKLNEAFKNSNIIAHFIEAVKETLKIKINVKGGIFGGLFNLPPGLGKTLFAIGAALGIIAPLAFKAANGIIDLGAKLSLFHGSAAAFAAYAFQLGTAGDATISFGKVMKKFEKSNLSTIQLLKTGFTALGGTIAEKFEKLSIVAVDLASDYAGIFAESGVFGVARYTFQLLGEAIRRVVGHITNLGSAILNFVAANPWIGVVAGIAAVVGAIVYLWKTNEEFREFIKDTWENNIKPVLDSITDTLKDVWENHLKPFWEEHLEPLVKELWKTIKDIWDKIANLVGSVIRVVAPVFTSVLSVIGSFITTALKLFGNFMDLLGDFLTFLSDVFAGNWGKVWDDILAMFSDVVDGLKILGTGLANSLIGVGEAIANAFVGAFNWVKSVINSIDITIPKWVPKYGGSTIGFDLPMSSKFSFPRLAEGGVLDSPTVAMLGEYANAKSNPEIAAPQSLLEGIISRQNDDVISANAQFTRQIIAAIEDMDFSITIGDDTIAASAQRGNKNYQRRTGKTLFGY